MPAPKKMYTNLDLAKFLCALLVIVIHTAPMVNHTIAHIYISDVLCRVSVPLFFGISGFLLFGQMVWENGKNTGLCTQSQSSVVLLEAHCRTLLILVDSLFGNSNPALVHNRLVGMGSCQGCALFVVVCWSVLPSLVSSFPDLVNPPILLYPLQDPAFCCTNIRCGAVDSTMLVYRLQLDLGRGSRRFGFDRQRIRYCDWSSLLDITHYDDGCFSCCRPGPR